MWYVLLNVAGNGEALTDALRVGQKEKGPRIKSQHMKEMTQRTIITHTRLSLLESIGHGKEDSRESHKHLVLYL